MNDATNIGVVFLGLGAILSVIVPLLVWFGNITQKLTRAITTLEVTMKHLGEHSAAHDKRLDDHEGWLQQLDVSIENLKNRI